MKQVWPRIQTAENLAPRYLLVTVMASWALLTARGAPTEIQDFAAAGAGIVQKLGAGDFGSVAARFDSWMAKALPEEKLAEQWKELAVLAGPLIAVKKTAITEEAGGYRCVAMTVAFQNAPDDDVLVVFDQTGRIAGLYFGPQPTEEPKEWNAPDYVDRNHFHEVPLTVQRGPWHLPATLTVPNSSGPLPAVLLVPGSPPVDQDETVGPNKVFKDLAWGLASRGIVVLRYTKRTHQFGAGLGGGQVSSFNRREELDDDALAALALLAGRPEVSRKQLYLLGHSLGGVTVTKIASGKGDPQIAGIAIFGTPAGDLLTVLLKRVEDSVQAGGPGSQQMAAMIPVFKKLRDGGFEPGEIVELFGERNPAGYWLDMRGYAAGKAAAQLKIPVLVAVGGHDAEVSPDDWEQWKNAVAGKTNATVKSYPGLFHLFMPSTATGKGDLPEDWSRPAHVARDVVTDTASWIVAQGKP